MTAQTKARMVRFLDVKAPVAMTGEEFLDAAKKALGIWGGMGHSISRDDDLEVSIHFDPHTADGDLMGVVRWLDSLEVEYTLSLKVWAEDNS